MWVTSLCGFVRARICTCTSDMSETVSRVCPSLGRGQACLAVCEGVFLSLPSPRGCESELCLSSNGGCEETRVVYLAWVCVLLLAGLLSKMPAESTSLPLNGYMRRVSVGVDLCACAVNMGTCICVCGRQCAQGHRPSPSARNAGSPGSFVVLLRPQQRPSHIFHLILHLLELLPPPMTG